MNLFNVATLRIRLVLWSILVNAILLIGLGVGVWWGLRQVQRYQIDDTLQLSASQLTAAIDAVNGHFMVPPDDARALINRGVLAWVVNRDGQVDATIGQAATIPLPVLGNDAQATITIDDIPFRFYRQHFDDLSAQLTVGMSLEPLEQTSHLVLLILAIAIPVALVISAVGAAFLAGRALAPIALITAQARHISHENLSERLALTGPADEVGQLAQTFNHMLDRLQAAFEHERQFIGDASHELRTPLSLLKAQLSLALSRSRDAITLTAMMKDMENDVDRLTRLVEKMLSLTRSETMPLQAMPVDISDVLSGLITQLQQIATTRQIKLTLDAPHEAFVVGDRDQLIQLFLNLLDNALSYTLAAGTVHVRLKAMGQNWQIEVTDTGAGIGAEQLPHVFGRFFRADSSRTRQTGGTGLGLAIAQAIAHQHGGLITAHSQLGHGSTFIVILPIFTP